MYTIKQAAARTGVPIALLRAWERRYGIVEPSRTPSGYRLYDDAALDRLRAMRRLVDDGWAPSVAAAAIASGEIPVEGPDAPDPTGPNRASGDGAAAAPAALIDGFVAAAAELDAARLEAILDEMTAAGSFETVADDLLLPALVALGDAWADGRVTVAAEHAASHAVLRRLAGAFQAAGRPAAATGSIVVGLPPGARHELAALAFAIAARRAGLPVLYLGPDLPIADWVATARRTSARAAVIGSPIRADATAAAEVGRALRASNPGLLLAFGGHGAARAETMLGPDAAATVLPDGVTDAVDALVRVLGTAS